MKLGPQSASGHVSRRRYAHLRGVDEKAVRKAIEAGILKPALRDGLIDVSAADALMAAHKIGGPTVATGLVKARTRKLAAGVALLQDELADLEASVVPAAGVAALTRDLTLHMARALWPIASMSERLAGLAPATAMAALEDEVRNRLEALASTKVQAPRPKASKAKSEATLAEMTPVDLAARRADLQARRLEHQRALRTGELLHLAEAQAGAVDRVLRARTKLLAIPAKVAARFVGVVDAVELAPVLEAEVGEALTELASEHVTMVEIEAARHQTVDTLPGRLTFKVHHHHQQEKGATQ